MANTKQARKRVRQDIEHNLRLSAQRTRYRTAIKAVEKLVAAGNKAAAAEEFKKTSGILDRFACRGVLHKNAAARQKSRLSAAIKALA
mgnify:FL=1